MGNFGVEVVRLQLWVFMNRHSSKPVAVPFFNVLLKLAGQPTAQLRLKFMNFDFVVQITAYVGRMLQPSMHKIFNAAINSKILSIAISGDEIKIHHFADERRNKAVMWIL